MSLKEKLYSAKKAIRELGELEAGNCIKELLEGKNPLYLMSNLPLLLSLANAETEIDRMLAAILSAEIKPLPPKKSESGEH